MVKQEIKEQFTPEWIQIYDIVMASDTAAFLSLRSARDYNDARVGVSESPAKLSTTYLTYEFAGTSIEVTLRFEVHSDHYNLFKGEYAFDVEGNEVARSTLKCSVNYPCHGSVDPGVALARLEFYRKIATFVAGLELTFGRYSRLPWAIVRTKEELEREEQRARTAQIHRQLVALVTPHEHMRISGAEKHIELGEGFIFADGEHYVFLGNKKFCVKVSGRSATITRV